MGTILVSSVYNETVHPQYTMYRDLYLISCQNIVKMPLATIYITCDLQFMFYFIYPYNGCSVPLSYLKNCENVVLIHIAQQKLVCMFL